MKRQIRRNVFETNSSSMHSLSICKQGCNGFLSVDEETNKVITNFGEFGWGYEKYYSASKKLSYLVTMLVETHNECKSMEELCETEDFKNINSVVAEHCDCDGIFIDEEVGVKSYTWNGKEYSYFEHEGYVDHQSVMQINDLLDEYGCTIEEFIFDEGIKLIIDNDNH